MASRTGKDAFGIKSFRGEALNPRPVNQFEVDFIFADGLIPSLPLTDNGDKDVVSLKVNRVEGIDRMSGELQYFNDTNIMDAIEGTKQLRYTNSTVTFENDLVICRPRDGHRAEDSFLYDLDQVKKMLPEFYFSIVIRQYYGAYRYAQGEPDRVIHVPYCQPHYFEGTNLNADSDNTDKDEQKLYLVHSEGFIIPDDYTTEDIYSNEEFRTRLLPNLGE